MFDLFDDTPIGIDLGTTNSCIGYWNGKEVKIIPNKIGERTTPSIVYFLNNEEEYLVGEQRLKYLTMDCQKIYSIKRIIGRDFNDKKLEEEISLLNYNIEKVKEKPVIPIVQKNKKKLYSPELISSLILKKLVKDAEDLLLVPIKKVVISVPAYFDDAQRCATIEAAKLAKLEVIRIINEPTAAALSYGLGQKFCPLNNESPSFSNLFKKNRELRREKKVLQNNSFFLLNENKEMSINKINIKNSFSEKGKNVMVFDLGGGTFDLAILQLNLEEKEYQVKSKYSNKYLGGDDFDNKLIDYCLYKYGLDKKNDNIDNISMERLRKACELAKKILSRREEAIIQVDNFINKRDIQIKIERQQFENEICNDLFDRLKEPFTELLEGAGLIDSNIDEIILVGGSTRMPRIKEILQNQFLCPIIDDINPDEVVAYGATIQAAMLMTIGKNKLLDGVKLFDITPISLGTDVINKSEDPKIKALGNKMSIIIPKWTRIPITKEKGYKTIKNDQDSMQICVFEGENDYLKYNKLLDKFTLINLPKRPKGQVNCTVIFEIDADNILNVTAYETTKNIKKNIQVLSSNKSQLNRHSLGSLSMSQLNEEKNKFDYDIEKYINNYINIKDINKKIQILENYNEIILKKINEINSKEEEEGINGNNIEKYFFYTYQLFESYEEMLSLKKDYKIDKNLDYILENIHKYINIFKKQNNYYIKQFLDLFKDTDSNIFLNIFYYSIKNFNEMGQYYIDNEQKFSRYYAKLYFEEVINLDNKYKVSINEGLNNPEIMSNIKNELNKSKSKLEEINSNAISLINQAKNERRLIEPLLNNNNKMFLQGFKEGTGFTYLKNKVNLENKLKNYDEYNLILDELEKISFSLSLLIKQANEEMKNNIFEELGICLGNIVKIKFSFLKGQKYTEYLKLIDRCLFFANSCNKNNLNVKWYKDALELKQEIENKNNYSEQEIINNIENKLNEIDNLFNQNNKLEFINHILENYPYKGYDKHTRPSYYDWNSINMELITFLSKQYHPDNYPQDTQEEKCTYRIIVSISKKLNNLLEEWTPENKMPYVIN